MFKIIVVAAVLAGAVHHVIGSAVAEASFAYLGETARYTCSPVVGGDLGVLAASCANNSNKSERIELARTSIEAGWVVVASK